MTKIRTGQAGTRCMRAAIVALAAATSLAFAGTVQADVITSQGNWYGTDGTDGTLRGRDADGNPINLLVDGAPNPDLKFVYDTYRDITWLADWNVSGETTLAAALTWAENLSYTVGDTVVDDWILPTLLNKDGSGPDTENFDDSEIGYIFYIATGNSIYASMTNTGPFTNISGRYWSSTESADDSSMQWAFQTLDGTPSQIAKNRSMPTYTYAVAIRPGDVFVSSTKPTTTAWLQSDPDPVTSGSTYTVSGTVTVDNQNDAPVSGNLPGSVTVSSTDSVLATCVDTDLTPSSSGTGVYDFACDILAGEPGVYLLDVRYADTSDPKVYSDSDDLSRASVLVEEPPPPPPVSCDGFFAPVDRAPTVNKANAGRVIPLKWRCTIDGVPADTYESFSVTSHVCDEDEASVASADAIEEYAPGGSGLMYHGDGYWQFNWATPKNYRNSCRTVTVGFDGETLDATFQFVR